jgi:hypothetical protein
MAEIYLTLKQLNTIFWHQTMIALGYDPVEFEDSENLPASMPVRKSWPTQGAPAWKITEDIAFIRVVEDDDPFNRLRHTEYEKITDNEAIETVSQTRVLQVSWIFYGPNSFDIAFKVKNALFKSFKRPLAALNLYLIPNIAVPRRVPEPYNGRWWERVDFSARFNELIKTEATTPYIKSATIIIKKEDGEERNVSIT